GYMFLGLGSAVLLLGYGTTEMNGARLRPAAAASMLGEGNLIVLGVSAAIFHLFTHAFFKALLFLGAAILMHDICHVIAMRRFSGLRRLLPLTHWTFHLGAAALAGIPPLAGFWSKDEILHAVFLASGQNSFAPSVYMILLVVGLVTAGLT